MEIFGRAYSYLAFLENKGYNKGVERDCKNTSYSFHNKFFDFHKEEITNGS